MLTLTLVPPLTFLKVENSAVFAVVRTRRRTRLAPVGTDSVTGTPVVPTDAAVTAVGAVTRATRSVVAPASGTAASAVGAPARAAAAVTTGGGRGPGGSVGGAALPGGSVCGGRFCGFSSGKLTTCPPRSETTVTHWQVVTGITESRASTDHVWSARTSAVPIRRAGSAARPL